MKILILEWKSYCVPDVTEAFQQLGHEVDCISCQEITQRNSSHFDAYFQSILAKKSCDMVFTFNFFPIVSITCNQLHIPYVSWVYDNPLIALYSYTVINPCNYIFIFDYHTYQELHNQGISTVYYLPLCANPKRLLDNYSSHPGCYQSDVSFVGSLYNEPRQCLYDRLDSLDAYSKGYLDALIFAQSRISGYFFLEDFLSPALISALKNAYPVTPNADGAESTSYVYAEYFLGRKSTALERQDLLAQISARFPLTVYTQTPPTSLPKAAYGGMVDYYDTMPQVFHNSRINLNITLKTIQTGIPLRCWDILGCGGFLLSNYQEEFLSYLVPGEDFVYYESMDDALEKIEYFLSHEKQRKEIAHNGLKKVTASHTFHHRVAEILKTVS